MVANHVVQSENMLTINLYFPEFINNKQILSKNVSFKG
jgi:hypothetical protein